MVKHLLVHQSDEKDNNKDLSTYSKLYLYKRIVNSKLYIDNHYSEKINLTAIATQACFSKFHFIRLFKQVYGKTPHQYLSCLRIEKAKLLLQKNISVYDTSFMVGFESPTAFAGLFKGQTGISPSNFQINYQNRNELIKKQPLSFIPNCFAETHGWKK